MGKITRLPGLSHLSEAEYKKFIDIERQEYLGRLKMICPSKHLRETAAEIAESDNSCEKCVYCGDTGAAGCRIPHTNVFMEALDIDPCYEGVLLYMSKAMERKQDEKGVTFDEIDDLLDGMRSALYDNLETIYALATILTFVTENNQTLSQATLNCVRSIRDTTKQLMDDWDSCDDECCYYERTTFYRKKLRTQF